MLSKKILKNRLWRALAVLIGIAPAMAIAHVSEQGFVLLLPTNVYVTSGVAAVVLTVVALAIIPARLLDPLFGAVTLRQVPLFRADAQKCAVSTASFGLLLVLLSLGWYGPTDPLQNLLPLVIWTVWWIGLVLLHALFGNLWRWMNPWSGPVFIVNKLLGRQQHSGRQQYSTTTPPPDQKPMSWAEVNAWPALLLFVAFALFSLAYLAPDDPRKLTIVVATYWLLNFIGMLATSERWWQTRVECFSVLFSIYAMMAPVARNRAACLCIGTPGWRVFQTSSGIVSTSVAIFVLVLLGVGSFDGLNETFWWLHLIGINPLAFPGRSAVVSETIVGLLLANAALIAVFGLCVYAGLHLARNSQDRQDQPLPDVTFQRAFTSLALTVLPIALAYHFAHFLTAFMVNIQYTVIAASDPLHNGQDLLGIGKTYVTSGFLNHHHTVRIIWLTQAGAVVFGHVLSVMLAHAVAVHLFGSAKRAVMSQLPLAVFMILYTLLGLWLLASPSGA